MNQPDHLDDSDLEIIANKVANLLGAQLGDSNFIPDFEIAETFAVWRPPTDRPVDFAGNLADTFVYTGEWHSQIRLADGKLSAVHSEKSNVPPPNQWSINEFLSEDLALAMDEIIDWIDAQSDIEWTARVVEIPLYAATAFWLTHDREEDKFVPVYNALEYEWTPENQLLNAVEFVNSFAKLKPIVGLTKDRSQN